ncbi:MAG TPA: hypothetical protein VI756_18345 [Blastocatellia bacterium]
MWCSEIFDSGTQSRYSVGAGTPPSSNPADIYRQLKKDTEGRDSHSYKINEQKVSFVRLARQWFKANEITREQKEEIVYWVRTASFDLWRPLIYVIPYGPVKDRVKPVPANKCAGLGPEYIIDDLKRTDFDIIEL